GLPTRFEIPLADLPRHPYQVRLDNRGNTLEAQTVAKPALRITPNRDPVIFAPGEQCSFELSPTMANLTPGTRLAIHATLTAARHKDVLWDSDQHLEVPVNGPPKLSLDVPLPRAEGVYAIHVSASRPSGFDRFWASSTKLAETSFQVVVL